MNIECLLKRPGGTRIALGGTAYHFKPDDLDRHVASVENPDHSKLLLGITEGYRSLDPLPPAQVTLADALAILRQQFPDADLSKIVGYTAEPAPAETEAIAPVDAATEAVAADDDKDDGAFADLSDDDLRAEFEKLLGRKPHQKMLRETMVAQIIAALSGDE
jgi:hypothetical protein